MATYCYTVESQMQSGTYSTSATPATEIDVATLKPGASRPFNIYNLRGVGRGAGLSLLSGIELNFKFLTTASTTGTTLTPSVNSVPGPAAVAVPKIGTGGGVNAVSGGSGGLTYRGGIGFGAAGPNSWTATTPDAGIQLDGGSTGSIDIFSISGTASLLYSFWEEFSEC